MAGKVWLVGAGPGDVGLLTIKGKKVLEQAEVVVYDRLVGDGILAMIPENAKTIDVGKRAGNHTLPQEKINQVLLEEAKDGKRVVRLKGGDPFLFGRGGEELELLVDHGIPYEVVPGITSPIAVPAYQGIPVTHRDFCSSLHIITGHKKAGQEYDIDFEALVRTKGTLVFLMGISALADICQGLLAHGMDPMMPAAVLQKGTTARQKRVVATVATLKEEVERQGIETPAIIVVGKVCTLADEFSWVENLALSGFKVVITRPKERISVMAEKLRTLGAEVLEIPAIATKAIENNQLLDQALNHMDQYQWIAFTSPTGVKVFFEEMKKRHMDIRKIGDVKIAAIGTGTARELNRYGLQVDLIPEQYDGAALGKELAKNCLENEHILLPRAEQGGQEILKEIKERKDLVVDDIPTYETYHPETGVLDEAALFENQNIDCAVFTSASTVRGFVKAAEGIDFSKVVAACIGRQTMEEAERHGMRAYMAEKATMDSLAELVVKLKQSY